MFDVPSEMSLDLNTILKDWPHENGHVKVRKITGLDGREKLQLRVDLGVLQMEVTGRPDGQRAPRPPFFSVRGNLAKPWPKSSADVTLLRIFFSIQIFPSSHQKTRRLHFLTNGSRK